MQRFKQRFSVTTATICCFIFPFNNLATLACLFRLGWQMTVDLFLNVFGLANGCTHRSLFLRRFLDALSCVAIISRTWMRSSCVASALFCARRRAFCYRIIRTFPAFNSRAVKTSSSACRRSSALKSEPFVLRLLAFFLLPSASDSSGPGYFSSISAKVRSFFASILLGPLYVLLSHSNQNIYLNCCLRSMKLTVLTH